VFRRNEGIQGKIRLFRPDMNMARMNKSSARIALPTFDPVAMIDLIAKFAEVDERFIPKYASLQLPYQRWDA
jgi:branched-subunit amino acid aminotransferase/4-amino-4-deoxychorismate lyase